NTISRNAELQKELITFQGRCPASTAVRRRIEMKKIVSIIALGAWSVAALAQSTGGTVKLTAPAGAKFATYGQLHIQVDRDGTVSVPAFMAQRLVAQGFTGAVAP